MASDERSCSSVLELYSVSSFLPGSPGDVGLILFATGLLYIAVSLLTLSWIKYQEYRAREEDYEAQSVIFPVFVHVLWITVLSCVYSGLVIAFLPLSAATYDDPLSSSLLYAFLIAFQHCIIEGIAFLLMQKGLGRHAANVTLRWTLVWGLLTFLVTFIVFYRDDLLANVLILLWDFAILFFYAALWLAPQDRLYRRPAAILYAKIWLYFRVLSTAVNFCSLFPESSDIAACLYILASLFLKAVIMPVSSAYTLLQDSRWWQGIEISQDGRTGSYENMRAPLLGTDFSLHSAQSLADTVDRIKLQVNMLNFARIKLHINQCLGSGSFSKVYKGAYNNKPCAIKLIYSVDLTEVEIKKVAAEASILSLIKNTNVVGIIGVSVLPPSVCLLLELCSFGSLSDIIRGHGFDWSAKKRPPLALCTANKLFLALGCARGLLAVHDFKSAMCHRDIKSFNFLVDSQLNAKIADLELGSAEQDTNGTTSSNSKPTALAVDEMLVNWLAPEVIRGSEYQQAADVYSLSIVFWEIISASLPFDGIPRSEILSMLVNGYRHPIPLDYINSPFANLIERMWNEDPNLRPHMSSVVADLEFIWSEVCCVSHIELQVQPDLQKLMEYYDMLQLITPDMLAGEDSNPYKPSQLTGASFTRASLVPGNADDLGSSLGGMFSSFIGGRSSLTRPSASGARSSLYGVDSSMLSHGTALKLTSSVPRDVQTILTTVRNLPHWRRFDESGQPWAVFSVDFPHILLYATPAWYLNFGVLEGISSASITPKSVKSLADFVRDMSDFEAKRVRKEQKNRRGFCSYLFGKKTPTSQNHSGINNNDVLEVTSPATESKSRHKTHLRKRKDDNSEEHSTINAAVFAFTHIGSDVAQAASFSSTDDFADEDHSRTVSLASNASSHIQAGVISRNNSLSSWASGRLGGSSSGKKSNGKRSNRAEVSEEYIDSMHTFFNQLEKQYGGQGVLPICRKVNNGKALESFLCAVQAFPIHNKNSSQEPLSGCQEEDEDSEENDSSNRPRLTEEQLLDDIRLSEYSGAAADSAAGLYDSSAAVAVPRLTSPFGSFVAAAVSPQWPVQSPPATAMGTPLTSSPRFSSLAAPVGFLRSKLGAQQGEQSTVASAANPIISATTRQSLMSDIALSERPPAAVLRSSCIDEIDLTQLLDGDIHANQAKSVQSVKGTGTGNQNNSYKAPTIPNMPTAVSETQPQLSLTTRESDGLAGRFSTMSNKPVNISKKVFGETAKSQGVGVKKPPSRVKATKPLFLAMLFTELIEQVPTERSDGTRGSEGSNQDSRSTFSNSTSGPPPDDEPILGKFWSKISNKSAGSSSRRNRNKSAAAVEISDFTVAYDGTTPNSMGTAELTSTI